MKIQQIRNAMVRIRYAGKTFLTDPWLAPRGSMGTFRDYPMFRCRPERLDLPLPLCDLPMPVADILTGVDAYIVTHVHPDHIDMAADGSVGAPLDNAIECVTAEPDPEKRLIRTAVYVQNGFVMFRFENYCAEPVELGPDGLPARSTHGGYDLKSLRALAQQHGGSMTVHWENQWFTVRMLLPLPKKA